MFAQAMSNTSTTALNRIENKGPIFRRPAVGWHWLKCPSWSSSCNAPRANRGRCRPSPRAPAIDRDTGRQPPHRGCTCGGAARPMRSGRTSAATTPQRPGRPAETESSPASRRRSRTASRPGASSGRRPRDRRRIGAARRRDSARRDARGRAALPRREKVRPSCAEMPSTVNSAGDTSTLATRSAAPVALPAPVSVKPRYR